MSSRCRSSLAALALCLLGCESRALRVCADPNHLPYSNQEGEGFENRIAEILAAELDAEADYFWWAQRRGFIRNTIKAGACDVVIGVPSELEMLAVTKPYYRSSYVFAWRKGEPLNLSSLDDPRLRTLTIGVQLVGDDGANPPAAKALALRGIVANVRGFTVYGDHHNPRHSAGVLEALTAKEVDTAVIWGPQISGWSDVSFAPVKPGENFVFDIAVGVSHENRALREELNRAIERRRDEIRAVLDEYGVPRVFQRRPHQRARRITHFCPRRHLSTLRGARRTPRRRRVGRSTARRINHVGSGWGALPPDRAGVVRGVDRRSRAACETRRGRRACQGWAITTSAGERSITASIAWRRPKGSSAPKLSSSTTSCARWSRARAM